MGYLTKLTLEQQSIPSETKWIFRVFLQEIMKKKEIREQ